uniref:A kinase (PRKA) anchor protein 9 n=1 Tax=Oryzias latipes TaxID=8090 RepID=A0A3P9HNG5_ORYLA
MEQKDRQIELLNDQISKLQQTGSSCENQVTEELLKELESQVEYLRSEQERLKRSNEEELEQLNEVIEKLQQELANIEPKTAAEEDEELKKEPGGDVWAPSEEEYDEMKQRKDHATKELDALRAQHGKLLDTYLRLKDGAEALAETENLANAEDELQDALREKTAGLLVLQAQVHALEQSAASRVEELEDLLQRRNSEVEALQLVVEQTQSWAQDLQQKVCDLEDRLREKVAEALVSQATLEAFQQHQQEETPAEELQRSTRMLALQMPSLPPLGFSGPHQAPQMPTGKLAHLTKKLLDLEQGLGAMQKDQELQKELLSSSEEEVDQYERRLGELMDLLKMISKTEENPSFSGLVLQVKASEDAADTAKLFQELQEVKTQAASTREELSFYRTHSEKLQEDLRATEMSISSLKEQLQEAQTALMKTTGSGSPSLSPSPQPSSSSSSSQPKRKGALPAPEPRAAATEEVEEVIGQFQEKIDQMQELHAAEILDMEARHIAESENLRRDLQALEAECKALKAVIDELRSAQLGFCSVSERTSCSPADAVTSLIREVHQEGMQVLSLSELPLSEGQAARHGGVPGWQKERDAVLATLESFKAVVAQTAGGADWRADLLDAVRQVFERERSVLKSAWFSQLGLLDTSDAVVHLNQLELRLDEQVTRRTRMPLLRTCWFTLEKPEMFVPASEPVWILTCWFWSSEKQQVHETCFSGNNERVSTDRAEVSQRAAEVEELNEQLMDQRKRSRDLQWAVEKEKCRTERSEENKREEVEDLQLSLEDLRTRVLQLTGSLEEQQQTSSALQQQAEQERLRLRRRLQVQLDTERAKAEELTSALGRERELRITTSSDPNVEEEQERLQRELDEKHAQVRHSAASRSEPFCCFMKQVRSLRVMLGSLRVILGSLRVMVGSVRVMVGSVRVMVGSLRVILGSLRVILGSLRVMLGMFCSCGPSEPDPYVGEGRFWSPPVPHRLSAEADADELSWIQSNVDEVVVLLQRTPGLPSFPEVFIVPGGTSNSLTERLLRQNAELTGFVSRLTEEKNDLRNRTLRLEEELRRYRQAGLGPGFSVSSWRFWENPQKPTEPSGSVLSQEREVWTQEKICLEKALLLAQAQISRLRGEIRSNAVLEITGPEADSRMYGRYLRAESFRKALVYQKKYLLLLLGGFQECEEATLFLLTRMGGRPALEPLSQRRRGLTRFRSAARVAIALSRMRFLVKRWHRAAGMNSAPSTKNGAGIEVREGGGEGVSGGRGRSGSPRSGASSSHPRLHAASDPAALTCSHLQGYDPDRALTDYISRLEALQRRLGSVKQTWSLSKIHFNIKKFL